MAAASDARSGTVQSIERAIALLRALAGGTAGVTEVAERVGLPKSTVSRLLSTLEQLDMVEQAPQGGYRLGAGIAELASATRPGRSLIAMARPQLAELNRLTGEAAGLSVPDGVDMLYLDQITPDSELQVRDWTGHRIPMHAVPSGQVVLADDESLAARVVAGGLQAFTTHTLATPATLRERLAVVRADGFAWAVEEFADGLTSVAAPVRDRDGRVIAALHVYGPSSRLPGGRDTAALGMMVKAAADRMQPDRQ